MSETERQFVFISILAPQDLLEPPYREIIFKTLVSVSKDTIPDRIGELDPAPKFTLKRALEEPVLDSFMWEKKKPYTLGSVFRCLYNEKVSSMSNIWVTTEVVDGYLKIFDIWAREIDMYFGALHVPNPDDDFKYIWMDHLMHLIGNPVYQRIAPSRDELLKSAHDGASVKVNDLDIAIALPTLFWITVFGPPYVEMFGKEKLFSAPAFRVEEVQKDQILIQLTERPEDVKRDLPRVLAVRDAVIDHIGRDAFFDVEAGLNGDYRVPDAVRIYGRTPTIGTA